MSDPVQITLIVCSTIVLIIFGLAGIQLLEKRNDKKKEEEWPDDLSSMP